MHNPPHPGEFIPGGAVSPEMALRLSKAPGRSPESWLAMQSNYDLWYARQNVKLGNVGKIKLTAA
jgi:plasmid maintenance system antidote protein VapI